MAPAYKLIYFDRAAAAEPIRFLFKYGNIEFEDVRIKGEDWPGMKPNVPFGQLPLLEHNGKTVNQTVAICRYVAKLVKLTGNDDWENLEIDAIVNTINDLRGKMIGLRAIKDEEKKLAQKEAIRTETIPFYLARIDAQIQRNQGYLALGRLTWADLYFANATPFIDRFSGSDVCSNHPNVKALVDRVTELPPIKKWLAERPPE